MRTKIPVGASRFNVDTPQIKYLCKKFDLEITPNPYGRKLTVSESIEFYKHATGVLAGLELFNEEVFAALPKLKAIARIGIGVDNIDFYSADKHGVIISSTPNEPTYAVAEMTLAALLTIARGIIPANLAMHNGEWKKEVGFSVCGSIILFIGYGRIARKFAELLSPFGAKVLICDPNVPDSDGSLEELLPKADVISLHASGNETVLGWKEFNLVKHGATLLNSARGELIDESALVDALSAGKIGHYWGDVFGEEPYSGELCGLENAILTPHISTYTTLCRSSMEFTALENLVKDLGYHEW